MQINLYKKWFKTRSKQNTHSHYYQTFSEVKADNIIDDMFSKLDADGGGTLDCGEITALFKENGIHMNEDQVANMFGEAQRMNSCAIYRKMLQQAMFKNADGRGTVKKSIDFYKSMAMDPETWKVVTKSPAALKSKCQVLFNRSWQGLSEIWKISEMKWQPRSNPSTSQSRWTSWWRVS